MTSNSLQLGKYSLGVGDRFAQQAKAQLEACVLASKRGVEVTPVWNKSNREHLIVGSDPGTVRSAAATAVCELDWRLQWHVDADHIRLETVDRFLPHADFYTIDVADSIGKRASDVAIKCFADSHPELLGKIEVPGIENSFHATRAELEAIAAKYLFSVQEVGAIYRYIEKNKDEGCFITEASMDETDQPQTPLELLVILAALADEKVPLQTIAPKFTGRFNKGVDYVGDIAKFEQEFNDDLAVIRLAVERYGLPKNLKLSIHSGSDKFSIYPAIRRALRKHDAGLHVKTAGTTWLEELIGLAEGSEEGLALAKKVYAESLDHIEELCAPYLAVIEIDRAKLPSADVVTKWSAHEYVSALRHDQTCQNFNLHLRQLLHVGYKVAAKMGNDYLSTVQRSNGAIGRNVTENLFNRHIVPLFILD